MVQFGRWILIHKFTKAEIILVRWVNSYSLTTNNNNDNDAVSILFVLWCLRIIIRIVHYMTGVINR